MKTCSKCKTAKDLCEFRIRKGKTANANPYHNNICRNCEREDRRIWMNNNKERQKKMTLASRKNNPEKYAAQRKRYYQKHKDRMKANSLKSYYDNHEKNLIRKREYSKNEDKIKRNERKRLDYRKNKKRHLEYTKKKNQKCRDKLGRRYLKSLLRDQGWPSECINSPILLEMKKISLLTKRKIKEIC